MAAGIRSAYVAPLLTSTGVCVGALSVHGERPGEPTRAEPARVDDIAAHAAEWLLWYRETTITDALNDLHARTRAVRG